MFVKTLAIVLVLGICVALPVEDSEHDAPLHSDVEHPHPQRSQRSGVEPPQQDSDLKTDASTWGRTYWYQPAYYIRTYDSYPVYRTYSYWY